MVPSPDPADADVTVGQAFTAAAPTYDAVIDFFGPFGRALAAAAHLSAGEQVLDVACGAGASLRPAVEAVGSSGSVVGVDLAEGMVGALRASLTREGISTASVVRADAGALPFPDGGADALLAGFMIFFTPDPPAVLAELCRVLRPGGRVALSVFDGPPAFSWYPTVVREVVGETPPRPGDEFNRASVLEAALVDVGFADASGADVVERFTFSSVEAFESWQRSHAGRLLLDRLDPDQLARWRGLVAQHLEGHRVHDGYEMVQRARMVTARRP